MLLSLRVLTNNTVTDTEHYGVWVDDAVLLNVNDATRMGCKAEVTVAVAGNLISPYWPGGPVPVGVTGSVGVATGADVIRSFPVKRSSTSHLDPNDGLFMEVVTVRFDPGRYLLRDRAAVVFAEWKAFSNEPDGATVPEGMARVGISAEPVLRFVDG